MLYLLLAMCSSALISVAMRFGETRIQNNLSAIAVNYVICLTLSLVYTISEGGSGAMFEASSEGRAALLMGLINGLFYVGSLVLLQYNISRNGVVLPPTFMKLGVLVPTMIAIVAFGERPGVLQIAGIAAAVAAIIVMNASGEKTETVTDPKALILLLLVGGSGDAMSKIYEELGSSRLNSQFLLYTFCSALVLCVLTAAVKGQRLTVPDLLIGCLIGIPNFYSARFLLMSLSYVPAVIAYPTYSTGTILLVSAAGVLLFREKMTSRQWVTVGMIIAALLLLNIGS